MSRAETSQAEAGLSVLGDLTPMAELVSLKSLDLSGCKLLDSASAPILQSLSGLTSLEALHVRFENSMEGVDLGCLGRG